MIFCAGLLVMLNGTATAADGSWTGSGSDSLWTTSGNWDTVPGAGDVATVDVTNNNPLVNMDVTDIYNEIYIGKTSSDEVTLTVQNGGHLRQSTSTMFMAVAYGSGSKGRLDMTGGTIDSRDFIVGQRGSGDVNVSGGTINVARNFYMGDRDGHGVSTFDLSGGTVDVASWAGVGVQSGGMQTMTVSGTGYLETGHLSLGLNDGDGTLTISDNGRVNLVATDSRLRIGEGGGGATGTINMNGGTLDVIDVISFGYSAGQSGSMNMTAGNISSSKQVRIGEHGTGTVTMSGGDITVSDWVGIGVYSDGAGTLNMSGGTMNAVNLTVGNDGNGTMDLSGGAVDVSNWIGVGREPGRTGSLTVRGAGYLEVKNLSVGLNDGVGTLTIADGGHVNLNDAGSRLRVGEGGTGTINMNGGTLDVDDHIALGYSTSSSMNMTDGDVSTGAFVVGLNATGTFGMSGGNLVLNSHVRVGEGAGEGVWTMSGGLLVATNYITAGWGTTGAGEMNLINMSGGELRTGDLELGRFGDGTFNLSDGVVNLNYYGNGAYTNGLVFDSNGGDGLLDITGNGTLNWLGGDFTGEVNAFVLSGDIIASGDGQFVSAVYDSGSNITVVTAIPEPATLGLLAFLGGAMLWIRRTFMN